MIINEICKGREKKHKYDHAPYKYCGSIVPSFFFDSFDPAAFLYVVRVSYYMFHHNADFFIISPDENALTDSIQRIRIIVDGIEQHQ